MPVCVPDHKSPWQSRRDTFEFGLNDVEIPREPAVVADSGKTNRLAICLNRGDLLAVSLGKQLMSEERGGYFSESTAYRFFEGDFGLVSLSQGRIILIL